MFSMAERDRAVNVSVSLYLSQIEKIKKHVKHSKRFRREAEFFQFIVNDYFSRDTKKILKDFMAFIGYPIIIMTIMLYVSISTDNINKNLIGRGIYYNDLAMLANGFFIVGFAGLGLCIAGFYWFYTSVKGE